MNKQESLGDILNKTISGLGEFVKTLRECADAISDDPAPLPTGLPLAAPKHHGPCADCHQHEKLDTPAMLAAVKKTAWLEAWAPPCEGQPALKAWVCWKGHHSCNVQICYEETHYSDGHNAHAHKRWVSTNCVPMRNDWTLTFAQHGDCHHE